MDLKVTMMEKLFFNRGEELGHMDIHVPQSFTVMFLILKVFNLNRGFYQTRQNC